MTTAASAGPPVAVQLSAIATRLLDIAGGVASEAETATAMLRGMTDQSARIASLAAALEAAANAMEAAVRRQAEALGTARRALTANRPTVAALARSVEGVSAISDSIAQIAQESRVLSLNARIEAARTGSAGSAFGVVATEMSTLSHRTGVATREIGERAIVVARDLGVANDVVVAHGTLVEEQGALLATTLDGAAQQRSAATELASITADTVGTVDRAAMAIGRVGANAVAVKLLARQVATLAAAPS